MTIDYTVFGAVLLGIIIYTYLYRSDDNNANGRINIRSTVDNREYSVRNLPDRMMAADLLAQIRGKLISLVELVKNKYPNDERVQNLKERFSINIPIEENIPKGKVTSYTINKGDKMMLCLRQGGASDNGAGSLMDLNTMTFVAIHELAHIASDTVDTHSHGEQFWNNMDFLVREAMNNGIYTYVDYSKMPQSYCGITISDTPTKGSGSSSVAPS